MRSCEVLRADVVPYRVFRNDFTLVGKAEMGPQFLWYDFTTSVSLFSQSTLITALALCTKHIMIVTLSKKFLFAVATRDFPIFYLSKGPQYHSFVCKGK